MLSYSEFDNLGGVDSFRSILPNKKISEDITRGRFEYNKPTRDYNELEKPQNSDKGKTRGDCLLRAWTSIFPEKVKSSEYLV